MSTEVLKFSSQPPVRLTPLSRDKFGTGSPAVEGGESRFATKWEGGEKGDQVSLTASLPGL